MATDEGLRQMCEDMLEIGCSRDEIAAAERLYRTASYDELIKHLKRCRCSLLEEMHECGRRVDRLDKLIRRSNNTAK